MKKIIAAAVVGAACLMNVSALSVEAARGNAGGGVGTNSLDYCLITGEERVPRTDCPIGQNTLLSTKNKTMTSEQRFLLAAARQRPQDGTGYRNGRNAGAGQNAGNGKQDGTGPGCVDGPRVDDCPYWNEKQANGTTDTTPNSSQSNTTQSSQAQSSAPAASTTATQTTYGQQLQDGTGNQYGNAAANRATAATPSNPGNSNSGQAGNQTGSAHHEYGNGVRDGSGGGTGKNAGNGLRDGSGAGGQRGRNAGTCVVN